MLLQSKQNNSHMYPAACLCLKIRPMGGQFQQFARLHRNCDLQRYRYRSFSLSHRDRLEIFQCSMPLPERRLLQTYSVVKDTPCLTMSSRKKAGQKILRDMRMICVVLPLSRVRGYLSLAPTLRLVHSGISALQPRLISTLLKTRLSHIELHLHDHHKAGK